MFNLLTTNLRRSSGTACAVQWSLIWAKWGPCFKNHVTMLVRPSMSKPFKVSSRWLVSLKLNCKLKVTGFCFQKSDCESIIYSSNSWCIVQFQISSLSQIVLCRRILDYSGTFRQFSTLSGIYGQNHLSGQTMKSGFWLTYGPYGWV